MEPLDLVLAERLVGLEVNRGAIDLVQYAIDRLAWCEIGKAIDRDRVTLADRVPEAWVSERESEHTLLL